MNIKIATEKYKLDVIFNFESNLDFIKNSDVHFSMEGNPFDFKQKAIVKYGGLITDMGLEYNLKKRRNGFTGEFSLKWNENSYTGNFKTEIIKDSASFRAVLQLPQVYSISLKTTGVWYDFSQEIDILIEEKAITLKTSVDMKNKLALTIDFTTPFQGLRNGNFNFFIESSGKNIRQELQIVYERKQLTQSLDAVISSKRMSVNLDIKTPFLDSLKNITLTLTHVGSMTNFISTGSLKLDETKNNINIELNPNIGEGKVKGDITLQIPEEYSIRLIHKGNMLNFASTVRLNFNED